MSGKDRMLSYVSLRFLIGHTSTINSVAWSPDGRMLASGSGDRTIRLWDGQTGQLLHTLEGHTSTINSVAWSPDGRMLASGSDDRTIRLWDGQTGQLLHTLEGHTGTITSTINSVAWSPDGRMLASGSGDRTIRLWDGQTGQLLHTLEGHTSTIRSVAWSPDGRMLASGSGDRTIRLWDGQTGQLLHTLEGHTGTIRSVAWSPDGRMLASGSTDDTVRLWDGQTGQLLYTLAGHTGTIRSVAWSPDGRMLATSGDRTIRLWDGQTGQLLHTFEGHTSTINSVAWSPDGRMLASGSGDDTIHLWDGQTGQLLYTLAGHTGTIRSVAWSPDGRMLASSGDRTIRLWDGQTGQLLHTLEGHTSTINSVAWSPDGRMLASGSGDDTVRLWDGQTGQLLHTLEGHTSTITSVAWSPDGHMLASGSGDRTIQLWDGQTGQLLHTLEGHTDSITSVAWSPDGFLFASKSNDGTIRLWSTRPWQTVEILEEVVSLALTSLAFHPHASELISLDKGDTAIRVWKVDTAALLATVPATSRVQYTTAKIALVGDGGVGKTGLGYRIAKDHYQVTEPTHGQQFWVVEKLGQVRSDGTLCEAILWDFAGQPNYRPIHALFLDDVDLALILFDPSRPDTLTGVDYWLKHLSSKKDSCSTILVAARTDVSPVSQSLSELNAFCHERNISGGFIATSAKLNEGIDPLLDLIRQQIDWDAKVTTITTQTFKRIKDYVLALKVKADRKNVLVSPVQLQAQLEATDSDWHFSDAEMMGAVGHLQNHGYVTVLRRSSDEERILLAPDLLINLAASFMLKAQENERGLGALDEVRVLRNEYTLREVDGLEDDERDTLLNAVTELFLKRNICFRESVDGQTFLIFPSLIIERPPRMVKDATLIEDITYVVTGRVENVYPALVVLLGYSSSFQRTHQWRKQAQYETQDGYICSFKLANDEPGELELVLYYGKNTPEYIRMRFQGLFEQILLTRHVTVKRYPSMFCPQCGRQQKRQAVIDRIQEGKTFLFCEEDGARMSLPKVPELMASIYKDRVEISRDEALSRMRTTYETALVRVKGFVRDRKDTTKPSCFISYAWGNVAHERWVLRLADDLRNADIDVVLDQLDNAAIGSSVARFISRIAESDYIIVVGTPSYRQKYENKVSKYGSIVAAEVDLINVRLISTEEQKASILPVLLAGEERTSLPPLLHGRVRRDFTHEEEYFANLFDLVLSLYHIAANDPVVRDMRTKLREEVEAFTSKRI